MGLDKGRVQSPKKKCYAVLMLNFQHFFLDLEPFPKSTDKEILKGFLENVNNKKQNFNL